MKLTKSAYNNLFGGFQMDHSINKRIILDRVKKKKQKKKKRKGENFFYSSKQWFPRVIFFPHFKVNRIFSDKNWKKEKLTKMHPHVQEMQKQLKDVSETPTTIRRQNNPTRKQFKKQNLTLSNRVYS